MPGVGKDLQDHSFTAMWSPPLKNPSVDQFTEWPFDIFGVIAIEDDGTAYFGIGVEPNWGVCTDIIV